MCFYFRAFIRYSFDFVASDFTWTQTQSDYIWQPLKQQCNTHRNALLISSKFTRDALFFCTVSMFYVQLSHSLPINILKIQPDVFLGARGGNAAITS